VGKLVPMQEEKYDAWAATGTPSLVEGLEEISKDFFCAADFEQEFFQRLGQVARSL
jgi:hypothetical protein